ncbi:MAG: tetratricopeptide repeat protein [Bacteroidota bacterium]
MAENNEDKFSTIEQTLSKTELFIEKNQKIISAVVLGLVVIVGGYFLYQKYVVVPKEQKAQAAMQWAQKYFEVDSLDLALNGKGADQMGFLDIIDEFGGTKAANTAYFCTGRIYLEKGKYEDAISYLNKYSADDIITSAEAIGLIGDANMELGKVDDAISFYKKAAAQNENQFTTPIFLMKAAVALEEQNKIDEALEIYERLNTEFVRTTEGRDAEKYIARLKTKAGKE